MARLAKDFDAVPDGEIHPRRFMAGEEVSGDVEREARAAGVLAPEGKTRGGKTKALNGAPENK